MSHSDAVATVTAKLGNGEAITPQELADFKTAFTEMSIVSRRFAVRDLVPAMVAALSRLGQAAAKNEQVMERSEHV